MPDNVSSKEVENEEGEIDSTTPDRKRPPGRLGIRDLMMAAVEKRYKELSDDDDDDDPHTDTCGQGVVQQVRVSGENCSATIHGPTTMSAVNTSML